MRNKYIPVIIALAMLLSLAACGQTPAPAPNTEPTQEPTASPTASAEPSPEPSAASTPGVPQTPPPSALPPLPDKTDYIMEDTFVISREGEDFIIGSTGLDMTAKEVCYAYGAEFVPYDNGTEENGKVPPIGGDIRFGMSYGEVAERLTGVRQELEPSLTLSSGYVNSYAGALTRMRFQFDVESDRLYLMGLDFMTDDPAAEWFALLEKFTQAFGEPTTPPRGDYTTPEELTAHLADGKHYAAAAWEGETKGLALMIRPQGSEISVSVEMKWLDLMPGMAGVQAG